MAIKKIQIFFSFFIFLLFSPTTYAHYNDNFMNGVITSDWGGGYCYKFLLGNNSQETIFDWKINFELDNNTEITGLWGGKKSKSGNKYIISGLDRNSNLNIGRTGVEVGFCTTGGKKPLNISFIKGGKKVSDKHYTTTNEANESEVDYEYAVDDNADMPSDTCYINTEIISKTNLVKNGGFEVFTSQNVIIHWCKNIWNRFFSFIGKFKTLDSWSSLNSDYKIWRNSDIKAQEGEAFIDIDIGNSISQNIKTSPNKTYELTFYTLGTDELEVKWNGTSIHKKANSYSGITVATDETTVSTSQNVSQTGNKTIFEYENDTLTPWGGINELPSNITSGGTSISGDVYFSLITSFAKDIYKVAGSINWFWLDLKSGDDVLDVGTLNVPLYAGSGNDTIRVNTANASIYLEDGHDQIQYNSHAGYLEAGTGDDKVKIAGNANSSLYLGSGNNELDISGNAGGIYASHNGQNKIKIGGNANNEILLSGGDDSVFVSQDANSINLYGGNNTLFIGRNANNQIDLGANDDTVFIGGTSNGTINFGDGNNFLSVSGTLNGRVNFGKDTDKAIFKGAINNNIYFNDGNDIAIVFAGSFNGIVYGGNGTDSLYLKNISSSSWNANENNIKNKVNSFERIIFSDGVEIGFDDESSPTPVIEEINYNTGSENKSIWVKHTYRVESSSSTTPLSFSNTKANFEEEKKVLQGNNFCNKFKNKNSCESGLVKSICQWDAGNCIGKNTYKYSYSCGRNNIGGILNLNYTKFTIPTHKNKLFCDIWGHGKKIYMGNGDNYIKYKFGSNNYFYLGNGVNIFAHSIYDSQLTNSTIEGGGGFNKFIIEDEDIDNFDITGDCLTQCTISLKNTAWTWWNGWRFQGITLKKVHEIHFKNSKKEFHSNKNSDSLFETDVRLGIDNVSIREVSIENETDKIDLMTLINDALKNRISNSSCSDIFYGLEDSIKKELINKMLSSSDYTNIAQDFLNTITTNSKQVVVKNITYELIKDKITPCHTQEEKNAFYTALYDQTVEKIDTCVLNNLNAQVQKQVEAISYLKTNMESCTQVGNTLTLNFFNSYGIHSK